MAASIEQKLDFLLKKIGYVASKTGIAEDSSLSGTKKAPFGEAIPSPLVTPATSIWADSIHVPATPPGSDTSYVKVYLSGSSGHQMTMDPTVSGNRTFIARSTYNNNSSTILGDWVDTSYGPDYIVKVYKGDPNSGGVQLSAAGSGSNDTWFFDYSSGVLNFNGTVVPSGVTSSNIYIVGYRYIGAKGAIPPAGIATFSNLYVSGVSTFVGVGTFNSDLYVGGNLEINGHTELDNVNVSGITTFANALDINSDIDVDGHTELDNVNIAGVSTFSGDIGSSLIPASDDTYDLGAPNDQWRNLYIDGAINTDQLLCSGNADFFSNVEIGGDLKIADKIVHTGDTDTAIRFPAANTFTVETAGSERLIIGPTGVSTFTGAVDIDGHTELDNVNIAGVTTFQSNAFFGDADYIQMGDSQDLKIGHVGSYSVILDQGEGNLSIGGDGFVDIMNTALNEYKARFTTNGSVELYFDNSKKFETTGYGATVFGTLQSQQLNVSGVSTFQSHVHLGDNDELRFGAGDDFKIYHDPNDARLENSNGDVKFKNTGSYFFFDEDGGETLASFINDGAVNLYYGGNKKFETTGIGVTITGETDINGDLNVSGVSTFTGAIDVNGDLDVDGHTNLDNVNISGVSTFTGSIHLPDSSGEPVGRILFGDDDDFKIYHDGNSYVSNTNSASNLFITSALGLQLRVNSSEAALAATANGTVELFYNGAEKFETTGAGVTVFGTTQTQQLNVTGIATATAFHTGAEGSAIRVTSNTISGPAEMFIDPAAVGDNTGALRIKGDLFVDGTQTVINSTTIELGDFIVGIATTATTDSLADGAGIKIGPDNTFLYDHSNTSLKSSENLNLASGKTYKIDGTDVLSATTLGSGVVNSSLTSLGTLLGLTVSGQTTLNTLNVTGVSTFSSANFNGDLTLTDTDAGSAAGPELKLFRNSASPADADYLGQIKFAGESDTGVERNYAKITGKILDASNGTEDGIIEFAHIKAGSQNISARFRSDSLQLLNGTNFSVAGNSTFTGNIDANGNLDVDGHTDLDNVSVAGVTTFSSRIVGAATTNIIPFLYSTFEDLPSASTYHGAFAHVHNRGRAYFSHAANWFELINKELNGTVGTGTERYDVGQIDATGSNVTGVSTSATLNVGVGGTVLNASVNNSRVGINSVTPAYALDVVGDINSSTDIKVNGVSIVSSSGASLDDVVALAIALG